MVNIILKTMVAKKFAKFCSVVNAVKDVNELACKTLNAKCKIVFNKNNCDKDAQRDLIERNFWRINLGIKTIAQLMSNKNIKLFKKMGVFSKEECKSRRNILHNHYAGTVDIEARCMINLIQKHIIPSVKATWNSMDQPGISFLAACLSNLPKLMKLSNRHVALTRVR